MKVARSSLKLHEAGERPSGRDIAALHGWNNFEELTPMRPRRIRLREHSQTLKLKQLPALDFDDDLDFPEFPGAASARSPRGWRATAATLVLASLTAFAILFLLLTGPTSLVTWLVMAILALLLVGGLQPGNGERLNQEEQTALFDWEDPDGAQTPDGPKRQT
jgi:hypothetical protein